jgi:hypothetical protein
MRIVDTTSRPTGDPPQRMAKIAEALMGAAAELTAGVEAAVPPQPDGVPVRSGRLSVGRVRRWLPPGDQPIMVVAGFATACWLGSNTEQCLDLGRLTYRDQTQLDPRGRVVLPRQVRAWLAVTNPAAFNVVTMSVATGGLLVIPVEDFARRYTAVTP